MIRAGFMKSIATEPVISAMENASPAANSRKRQFGIGEQDEEAERLRLVPLAPFKGTCGTSHLLH